MKTFYAESPDRIYEVRLERDGRLGVRDARLPRFSRRFNPAGLPDRIINGRLVAELGYTPRPGMRLGIPEDFDVNLSRGAVVEWPEMLAFRRSWPHAWNVPADYWEKIGKDAPANTIVIGLLGQNAKLIKRGEHPIVVMGVSLAPADASGNQVCVFSTPECRALCLFGTGKGAAAAKSERVRRFEEIYGELLRWGGGPEMARIARTIWLFEDPLGFLLQLSSDILWFIDKAAERGAVPAIRMNVLSDIRWENIPFPDLRRGVWAENVMSAFPDLQFYDYTKDPGRDLERLPPNYHLTFSLAETKASQRHAADMLRRGVNVTVVFDVKAGHPLPEEFWGLPVIDGDKTDLRFLDPSPAIVGLRFKNLTGKAAEGFQGRQKYGFIQDVMLTGDGLVVAKDERHYLKSAELLPRGKLCRTGAS